MRARRTRQAVLFVGLLTLTWTAPQPATAQDGATAASALTKRTRQTGWPRYEWYDVIVNGRSRGSALALYPEAGSSTWVESAQLARWGLDRAVGVAREMEDVNYTDLDSVRGLEYQVDDVRKRLLVAIDPALLPKQRLGEDSRDEIPEYQRGHGLWLNYDLFAARDVNTSANGSVSSFFNAGYSNRWGTLSHRFIFDDGANRDGLRLDTAWTTDLVRAQARLSVGDIVTSPGPLGQQTRGGGITLRRAFDLRPQDITFPIPVLSGTADLPSTIDLFIDSVRRARYEVDAGPFEIANPPLITGGGEAEVVVTNILGETRSSQLPFFVTPQLLRAGLWDYSLSLGREREAFGSENFGYGDTLASGALRHGVNDSLTLETRARHDAAYTSADLRASFQWRELPLLTTLGAGAWRLDDGDSGPIAHLALDYRQDDLVVSFDGSMVGNPPTEAAGTPSPLPFRSRWLFRIGRQLGINNVSASHVSRTLPGGERFATSSLRYSRPLPGRRSGQFFVEAFRIDDSGRAGADHGVRATLIWSPQPRRSFSTSTEFSDNPRLTASYQRQPRGELGTRYQVNVSQREQNQPELFAMGEHQFSKAAVRGQWRSSASSETASAGLAGSLGLLGGRPFIGRELGNAFALVDLAGHPGITVYRNNRPAAISDGRGLALIPRLQPYVENRLMVDATEVPLASQIDATVVSLRPGRETGLNVAFGLRRDLGVELTLLQNPVTPVPAGAVVQLELSTRRHLVGKQGRSYVSGLELGDNRLVARWAGGQCETVIRLDDWPDDPLPDLGRRLCE